MKDTENADIILVSIVVLGVLLMTTFVMTLAYPCHGTNENNENMNIGVLNQSNDSTDFSDKKKSSILKPNGALDMSNIQIVENRALDI